MSVQPVGGGAPGEAASAVTDEQRAAHRGGNGAGATPHGERLAGRAIDGGDDARIAAQAPRRLPREGRVRLDLTAPGPGAGEHRGVHVDHDLMPVGRKGRSVARFKHPVGHPRERIGPSHGDRWLRGRRPTWDVRRGALGVLLAPDRGRLLGRVSVHRRLQSTQDARGHLRRKPPVQDHRAVVLVPEGQAALALPRIGTFGFVRLGRLPVEANELLHVRRGAVQTDFEQVRFVVGGGDAGERASLGVPSSPLESASDRSGRSSSARATRTFSRAVWASMPQAQLSQWAHDSAPCAAHSSRRSSSAMRTRRR